MLGLSVDRISPGDIKQFKLKALIKDAEDRTADRLEIDLQHRLLPDGSTPG